MASLTPVDYDPFAAPPQAATVGAPALTVHVGATKASGPTLTPVDYDPFAPAGPSWLDTAGDIAQSAATGIEKGAIGMATAPVMIGDALHGVVSAGLDKALGPKPPPAPTMADMVTGAQPTGGLLHDIATNTGNYIGPAAITRGVEDLAGPMYQPQTTAGKYAETVGEFLPGATSGKSAAQVVGNVLKYAVAPGVASEGAGELTQGSPWEPYARAIAPIVVGGVGALAARPSSPAQVLRNAVGVTDPQALMDAQSLMDAARAQGSPISLAEAVQQVTNSGTRLASLQRVVEQSRGGAEPMAQFYAQRPAQVQAAGAAAIDKIGTTPFEPTTIAPAVQQAAESVMGTAHRARTAATSPLYKAAAKDTVPANRVNAVLSHIDGQIAADKTGLLAGPLGELRNRLTLEPGKPAIPATPATRTPVTGPNGQVIRYDVTPGTPAVPPTPRLPITDVENISRVRKYFRDKTELPQFASDAIDKETGSRVGKVLDTLDKVMTAASPAYKAANVRFQNISKQVVEPLDNGMVGALSRSKDFSTQANIILGNNPLPGSATEVADAVKLIKAKAPEAARALVSQRIRQVFAEATQTNMGGPNQWGGAKFNAIIRGNDQQARNLKAAVEALQGPGVWRDFQKTLDVFEAMGRRQAPGSQTEFNRQISKELERGGLIGEAASIGASPHAWVTKARDIYEGWRYGRNTEELARLLTRPDAASALAGIAKLPAGSSRAEGMAAAYLLNTAAGQLGKPVTK